MALSLISMMSHLFVLLQLLLGGLRLRNSCIIMSVVGEGPLNENFLLNSVAILFRRPLGNLGRT